MSLTNFFEFLWLGSGGIVCIVWSIQNSLENANKQGLVWSFILFSTGLWLIVGSFIFTSIWMLFPYISLIHIPFVFCSAPLLYLYLESIFLEKEIQIRFYHLLPSALSILLIIPFYTYSPSEMILLLDSQNQSSYANLLRFLNLAVKLILLFYVGLFLVRHWLPNVNWKVFLHKNAIFTLAFVILIWLDLLIGTMGFLLKIAFFRKLSAYLLPLLMYFYFFTRSLWSPFLSDVKDNIQKNKYEKSKIASMDLDALELRLIQLMSEKIFCDEDLTLTRLASLLGVKQGQLSEYFQRRFGFGFYHFINQHRVNEAKLLLLESPSRSVLSVADAVGFNSKSTFNRVFLEIVGMTPTEFRISGKN